ncbi:MAG: nucleotidyl transferase AbiEii/AbiGii toxin family protein, partial [Proteobacteria bacterium]|nr:nucleotidyl transferase AbiEii/AbiGii toxin family protein [Pseudomonadota bacterium]
RDWYDFNWYIKQKISPNLSLLKNALIQHGPWQNRHDIDVDLDWLKKVLKEKIKSIKWQEAAKDVKRFLNTTDQISISLWSKHFFISKTEQLKSK